MTFSAASSSWWLKLERASNHFGDIESMVNTMCGPSPRRIRVEKNLQGTEWIYTVHHDLQVPRMLPVIVGEFLFDVRSSLDHLMAVCVSIGAEDKSQFPIFTQDIWAAGSSQKETKRLESNRATWDRYTQGAKPEVIAFLRSVQPYQRALHNAANPEDHALAILNEFQNADKHRQLGIVSTGLTGISAAVIESNGRRVDLGLSPVGSDEMLPDGARCLSTQKEVDVEITGTVKVAMRSGPKGTHREITDSLHAVLETGWLMLTEIEKLI